MTSVNSILLASTDPARLRDWYAAGLDPVERADIDGYLILRFGGFYLMIDRRADVGDKNPEPGRMILNFDGEAFVVRIERRAFRYCPGFEDAFELEPQVVMKARCSVLLDVKAQPIG